MATKPSITLRQMRAFLEAHRLRNMTHAAEALNVTQSAMSALIRQFEEELGVQVFERTPRLLRPTRAGDHVFAQVQDILRQVSLLGDSMRDFAERIERVLAFSCSLALSSTVIPTVLADFRRQYPDVKTVMYDSADAGLIERVLSEDAEFSIGFFEPTPESVAREPLIVDHLCAVCATGSPLAAKERVTWRDLANQPLISLTRSSQMQELIADALVATGSRCFPAFEVGYMHTALAMAARGLGVLVLPGYYFAKGNPHEGALVARKLHEPVIERSLMVHARAGHAFSGVAVAFLDLLKKHLHAHA
jgi:DNA-binding transcriptional LysR family regulator